MKNFLLIFLSFLFSIKSFSQEKVETKIIAHRGAWKNTNSPQNSIASLKKAIEMECYGSEFDVRMTKDNKLIINHDPHFEGLDIEKTNFKNLRKVLLKNGEKIPTLKEYLKAGKHQNKTKLITEIKPSPAGKERSLQLAEATFKLINKMKLMDKVVFISFDYDILLKIHELNPQANTQYLNGEHSPEKLKSDGITGADYHFSVFQKDEKWIENAQKIGIKTNSWTVNNSTLMDYFIIKKIDFLTTDEPEIALGKVK
jgi:glycerophosphoryl diester phosphodiesterase